MTPGGSPRGSRAGRTADHLTILFSQKILAVRSGNCIYRLVRCWLCYFLICWSCRGEGPGIYFLCFTISFYDQPLIVVIITFSRLSDYKIACYALLYKLAPNGQAVWLVAVCVGAGMCFCRPAENFCFWSSILYLARKNHDSFARWTAKAENYSRSRVLILAEGN